jgi:hypothetical protein
MDCTPWRPTMICMPACSRRRRDHTIPNPRDRCDIARPADGRKPLTADMIGVCSRVSTAGRVTRSTARAGRAAGLSLERPDRARRGSRPRSSSNQDDLASRVDDAAFRIGGARPLPGRPRPSPARSHLWDRPTSSAGRTISPSAEAVSSSAGTSSSWMRDESVLRRYDTFLGAGRERPLPAWHLPRCSPRASSADTRSCCLKDASSSARM